MYRCQISKKLSVPGEPAYKIVTETRTKEYFRYEDKISTGTEIVKELLVCREEYLKHRAQNDT